MMSTTTGVMIMHPNTNRVMSAVGIPSALDSAIEQIIAGRTRAIDLVRVTSDTIRYFVNVSSGGFSGVVDEKLTPEMKRTWGPLAYLRGAAAAFAELRGYTPIVAQQIEYSLVQRAPEREVLPMARAFGLATVGWSPLGGGVLTGKYRKGESGRETGMGGRLFHPENTPKKTAILDTLEQVSQEAGSNLSRVAIARVSARARFR